MEKFSDKKIIDSWEKNSSPWIDAIEGKTIESRRLVTDNAIIETVHCAGGGTVLDIGCGEGWLARSLSGLGYEVAGIDAVQALLDKAVENGGATYHLAKYEELSAELFDHSFDVVVCNFSLLGKESVEKLFQVVPTLLSKDGRFIIQTLHPLYVGFDHYIDGWREGSWAGIGDQFVDPAPWYFRKISSWIDLYLRNGLKIERMLEPVNPKTGVVVSLILDGILVE